MSSFEFLGPYRIGDLIGRGGMGSVFAAVHEKSGERVAVKLIAQHVADEMRFRRRFEAEVKSLQRLSHPGIVRLIGYGEEKGRLFYSMELVEGESLQRRIRREKKLDWRVTLDLAIQICSALKHAHDIGVIHRDLKPANLLLAENDQVKLVDFGIAKVFGDGEQTLAGSVLGTADFMAPEQADSSGVTPRTDLYALGSVMYAMLTGRPPFTGKKLTEVIESLKRSRPVPLDLINPELPDDLVELVHQLLEKDPQLRPPTALSVMNRLKSMRAGLQREATVMSAEAATRIDEEPPASGGDTNADAGDLGSAVTGVAIQDGTRQARPGTLVSKAGSHSVARPSVDEPTIVSENDFTSGPNRPTDPEPKPPQTHFQTVDHTKPAGGFFGSDSNSGQHWANLVLLILTIMAAVGGIAWFLHSTRLPDADTTFARVTETRELQAMNDFLRRFPDDTRAEQVRDLQVKTRVDRTLRRLNTQSKLGVTPLTALEQGFVDAMRARQQDPQKASAQLSLWLDVHGNASVSRDPVEEEIVALGEYERDRLARAEPEAVIDERARELIERIREGLDTASVEESRKLLEGILTLHQDDAWAGPALDEARSQLEALDEFSEDEFSEEEQPAD